MSSAEYSESSGSKAKRVATMQDHAVAAAAEARFRFANEEQAKDALDKICRRFMLAKDSPTPEGSTKYTEAKLWIRGFSVTAEEKQKGVRGNYAYIAIKKVEGNRYTLFAEKLAIDLSHHPEKERPKARYPNWWHPFLRAALAEKTYPNVASAYKQLMALHYEYPEVTIPGADTLRAMVYSYHDDHSVPIDKMVIKIRVLSEGGVKLVIKGEKPDRKAAKKKAPKPVVKNEQTTKEKIITESLGTGDADVVSEKTIAEKLKDSTKSKGKFATMIITRRRKRTMPVRKTPKTEG